jgi:RNA polymerase sigma factor (sigma-70 family)
MDDHTLLADFAAGGKPEALAELARRYEPLVLAAAMRQVADSHLAQDITQATMLTLMRKARRIRSDTPLGPWLLRVTYFLATDALREQSVRRRHEQLAAQLRPERFESCPWRSLEPVIDQTLNEMRRNDRTILILRYLQEWSMPRIADELRLTQEAARQRLSRAVLRLRNRLARRGIGRDDLAILLPLPAVESADSSAPRLSAVHRLLKLLHLNALTAVAAVAIVSGGLVAARAALHRAPVGLSANARPIAPPPLPGSRPQSTVP